MAEARPGQGVPSCDDQRHSADLRSGAKIEAGRGGKEVFLLDVREPHEYKIANLGAPLIRLADLERCASELAHKKNDEIVKYFKAGIRSQNAALTLKQAGFTNVSNLTGSILAWAEKIDLSMPKY